MLESASLIHVDELLLFTIGDMNVNCIGLIEFHHYLRYVFCVFDLLFSGLFCTTSFALAPVNLIPK